MEKSKKPRRQRKSSLSFVSPLSLEECVYRLQQLQNPDVRVRVTQFDSDYFTFKIRVPQSRKNDTEFDNVARGELRRWEGTLTRVNCGLAIPILLRLILLYGITAFACCATSVLFIQSLLERKPDCLIVGIFMIALGVFIAQERFIDDAGLMELIEDTLSTYP